MRNLKKENKIIEKLKQQLDLFFLKNLYTSTKTLILEIFKFYKFSGTEQKKEFCFCKKASRAIRIEAVR
jgi:hypothetical protein